MARLNMGDHFERVVHPNGEEVIDLSTFRYHDFIRFLSPGAREITVLTDEEGAPDLIAFRQYNDHRYWWVICLFNHITDPFTQLRAGDSIRIPSQHLVDRYRSNLSERRASLPVRVTLN